MSSRMPMEMQNRLEATARLVDHIARNWGVQLPNVDVNILNVPGRLFDATGEIEPTIQRGGGCTKDIVFAQAGEFPKSVVATLYCNHEEELGERAACRNQASLDTEQE